MRTINRKVLAFLLSLLLVFLLAGFAFAETPQEVNYNGNPIVVVGGYGGARSALGRGAGQARPFLSALLDL